MGKLEHMMKVVLLLLIGVLAVSAAPTWTKTLTTQLSDVGGHTTTSCHCNGCSADKHTVAMADNATACAQACIAANNANAGSCKISLFDADRNVPPMGTKCFLYSEHPTADNTNPNAGVSSQGLSRFTCWQPADTTVSTHAPSSVNGWVKGANGATCDATCSGQGKSCNNGQMSALTSWDKVRNAFAAAGYSCRGAHGARNYAGTPFSTARSDDCAPVSSGTVVCNSNAAGHHAPLCCCVSSGQTASNVCPHHRLSQKPGRTLLG